MAATVNLAERVRLLSRQYTPGPTAAGDDVFMGMDQDIGTWQRRIRVLQVRRCAGRE